MKYFFTLLLAAPLVCSGCVWKTGVLAPKENLALKASQRGAMPPIPPAIPTEGPAPTSRSNQSSREYVRGGTPRPERGPENGTGRRTRWRDHEPLRPESITNSNVHASIDGLEAEVEQAENGGRSSASRMGGLGLPVDPGPVTDTRGLRR